MDLGNCPKCGAKWTAGYEKCTECGFVAIGAGLKHLPKKVRPKFKKFEEPGSWGPFIRGSLVMSLISFMVLERPWQNAWSYIRVLTGEPMPFTVKGDWDVVRAIRTQKGPTVFVDRPYQFARIYFKDGTVNLTFSSEGSALEATGKYTEDKGVVTITGLKAVGDTANFPDKLPMSVISTDENNAAANVDGRETITLIKRGSKEGSGEMLARFDATSPKQGYTMSQMGRR